jgi:hypothetical protein
MAQSRQFHCIPLKIPLPLPHIIARNRFLRQNKA